jgi:hypothetical protein
LPLFFKEKSQLKGISETRIEPGGWSENKWFAGFVGQKTSGLPVFYKTGRFTRFSPVR